MANRKLSRRDFIGTASAFCLLPNNINKRPVIVTAAAHDFFLGQLIVVDECRWTVTGVTKTTFDIERAND